MYVCLHILSARPAPPPQKNNNNYDINININLIYNVHRAPVIVRNRDRRRLRQLFPVKINAIKSIN